MILKSINLKNIRSYRDQRIVFPEGSTLLAGDIGSGKSSILHSIEFALFGARRDSISGDALLRKGEKEGEVELSFSLGKDDVRIMRKLKRQQGSVAQDAGFISVGGRRMDGTATELKAKVLDLLGYPRDLLTKSKSLIYRYTVYTPQEEMKNIIMESDELRIDTLRKVFGIDRYKRVAENAVIYIRSLKEERKRLEGVAQGIDVKRKELEQRREGIDAKKAERRELLPLLEGAKERKARVSDALARTEEDIRILNELKNKVKVFDARLSEIVRVRSRNSSDAEILGAEIAQLKRRLEDAFLEEKDFPPAEEVEDRLEKLQKELNESSSRRSGLAERLRQVRDRISGVDEDIKSRAERLSKAGASEAEYRALLEEVKEKETVAGNIDSISSKLEEVQRIIAELESAKSSSEKLNGDIKSLDTCPTCRQDVSEVHKRSIADEEERRIGRLDKELEGVRGERNRLSAMLRKSNAVFDRIADKERRLAALKVEVTNLASVREELEGLKARRAALEEERVGLEERLGKLDERALERIKEDIESKRRLLREIREYDEKLREKKHNLKLLSDKKKRLEDISEHQEQLKREVARINSDKAGLSQQISSNSHVEKDYLRKKQELDDISEEEKRLEVKLGGIGKEIEGMESFASAIAEDIGRKQEALDRIAYLNSVQEWLEKMFISLMRTMEKHVMARVHTEFSELFTAWFNLLVEDEEISVRIDESFSPVVAQNGHDISISHLSGGEKTSIALAYRLALNKVINDVISTVRTRDLLILDEPTDGFSSEQLDKVRTVLDEIGIRQVILVSHESKIESFVDNVIRLHKNEHVSRVVS